MGHGILCKEERGAGCSISCDGSSDSSSKQKEI
jgi:hypothetical protein